MSNYYLWFTKNYNEPCRSLINLNQVASMIHISGNNYNITLINNEIVPVGLTTDQVYKLTTFLEKPPEGGGVITINIAS